MSSQTPAGTKVGHGLAKVLGIPTNEHQAKQEAVTRGESAYSTSTGDTYVEEEPHSIDWVLSLVPSGRQVVQYFIDLFPFLQWITKYNVQWLIGDLVAGITVGAVVVPQGMAYAKLAELPVQFGLYSSFMGVLIYWFFATSKDITIGPVAVLSTLTGNIVLDVTKAHKDVQGHEVASALAVIAGAIVCFIGLARAGWIVEFIPLPAITAYMTGSAISIAVGQVPTLMGITGFNTRASTYKVVINILKHLGRSKLDAAMGLTALTMLYLIRFVCNFCAKRSPSRAKMFFFLSTLRTVFVLLLYTLISYLVERHHRKKPTFSILGKVPRGFQNAGAPKITTSIISDFASQLPVVVIVMLIEHIAIAKSFGRVNNYTINPSQELVAIGIANLLGPFLGAYPATGSFTRTAIKAKAGVRTPIAGLITALVVLLAIYALPAVFYYISNASLAAVIIHAVGDLITPPRVVYQFWRVAPLDLIIFFAGVLVTIFSSIENGIYTTICVSVAILLFRFAKASGHFVGKVKIHSVIGDHVLEDKFHDRNADKDDSEERNIFLPIDHHDGSNPSIQVDSPYPGVFIYRFSEGYNYPNAFHYTNYLVSHIFANTRRTNPNSYPRLGDRPWNDPGPRRGVPEKDLSHLPTLKAVILDFSSVNNIDSTSVQTLIDIRNQLDRYVLPEKVQWHFACINNKWTKRALAASGFGYPSIPTTEYHRWTPIFNVADIGGDSSVAADADRDINRRLSQAPPRGKDLEIGRDEISNSSGELEVQKQLNNSKAYSSNKRTAVVHGLNLPLFHPDLTSALSAAIANIESAHNTDYKRGVGTETEQLKAE